MSSRSATTSTPPVSEGIEPLTAMTLAVHSDDSLLGRIELGDENAMASLYDAHSQIVYSVALRILRDVNAAEDVLQDVFLRIWRRPGSFVTAKGDLRGWLVITARNRAIDVLRVKGPLDPIDAIPLPALNHLFAHGEWTLAVEQSRILVEKLPKLERETLEMAFFEGLAHEEIAACTNVALGTVKSRIRSALQSLRHGLRA